MESVYITTRGPVTISISGFATKCDICHVWSEEKVELILHQNRACIYCSVWQHHEGTPGTGGPNLDTCLATGLVLVLVLIGWGRAIIRLPQAPTLAHLGMQCRQDAQLSRKH